MSNVLNISDLTKKAIAQTMGGDYMEQKGQLASYVASSGFRNTEDTTGKQINKARSDIDNAISSAIDTVNLNANQRFLQSRMSYLESSKDIESYQNALS